MQAVRRCSKRVEWRSKSHLNHLPGRSRNSPVLARKAHWQRSLTLQVAASAVRAGDFDYQIRTGLAATSAVARGNSQVVTQSFFPCQRVAAHGFGHFFARTSADASASNSLCEQDATIYLGFHALCFLMICLSTAPKATGGTGFAANILFRDASLTARRSSCSPEIRVIVLFLCTCS